MDNPAPVVQPQPEKEFVKWVGASRPFKPFSKQLFTTAIVIAVLVGLILLFAREWMLIIVMAAGLFAYYVWSTIPPEQIEYIITSKGIRIHGQLFAWGDLLRWWKEDKWDYHLLVVDAPTTVSRRLYLVLDKNKEKEVVETMTKYLLMEKPELTTMDKAGQWLMDKFPLEMR